VCVVGAPSPLFCKESPHLIRFPRGTDPTILTRPWLCIATDPLSRRVWPSTSCVQFQKRLAPPTQRFNVRQDVQKVGGTRSKLARVRLARFSRGPAGRAGEHRSLAVFEERVLVVFRVLMCFGDFDVVQHPPTLQPHPLVLLWRLWIGQRNERQPPTASKPTSECQG